MANGVLVSIERVLRRHEASELCLADEFFRPLKARDRGAVGPNICAVGVGPDHLGLAMPERGEIDVDLARHANHHDSASRASNADRALDRSRVADGIDGDIGASRKVLAQHSAARCPANRSTEFAWRYDDVGAEFCCELLLNWILR